MSKTRAKDCSLAYCNAYPDLKRVFCGKKVCTTDWESRKCLSHWNSRGQGEGRKPDPMACAARGSPWQKFHGDYWTRHADWWKNCPKKCDTCAAGINLGLDFMTCCPDTPPIKDDNSTEERGTCRKVDQATVDQTQCGYVSAKCETLTVWYNNEHNMTQKLTGDAYETYEETFQQRGGAWGWMPWRFTMWKHARCLRNKAGEYSCANQKRCMCAMSPKDQHGVPQSDFSCDNMPPRVEQSLGVYCSQF